MAESKTNIYDLVAEVNKKKKKSSMAVEKEINDIYSMLDDIKDNNNISIEEVREKVNGYSNSTSKIINDKLENYSNVVLKPELPHNIANFDKYSECIISYIASVDYGSNNSKEYVEGHKAALSKYFSEITNNPKDIFVVESHVNEDINHFISKASLRDKGYYDGLFYVLKAIKSANETLTSKINNKLVEKLR